MIKYRKFNIDFIGHKKIYFGISLGLIAIGIIFNIIFGTVLDIQFTGGAVVKYSYTGEIDANELTDVIQKATTDQISVQISKDILAGSDGNVSNNVSVEFPGNQAISIDEQTTLDQALQEKFPDNSFEKIESSSVDPTNGSKFFLKCMVAIALAAILMIVYVAFRFRKIGGWSAGCMAVVALLHDVTIIYFTFVVFRMPLDDNFIAVVLMILGYSLNDTIIIYDRVRENRRLMGPKTPIRDLVNKSINQTLTRTINTSLTTAAAIGTVLVVALIFNLPSVTSFALPMLVGVISGCYSTICIAGPLWVMWQEQKKKKEDMLLAQTSKTKKSKK